MTTQRFLQTGYIKLSQFNFIKFKAQTIETKYLFLRIFLLIHDGLPHWNLINTVIIFYNLEISAAKCESSVVIGWHLQKISQPKLFFYSVCVYMSYHRWYILYNWLQYPRVKLFLWNQLVHYFKWGHLDLWNNFNPYNPRTVCVK